MFGLTPVQPEYIPTRLAKRASAFERGFEMPTVSEELASMRTLLDSITGDLDAMIKNAAESDEVEEEEQSWHAC